MTELDATRERLQEGFISARDYKKVFDYIAEQRAEIERLKAKREKWTDHSKPCPLCGAYQDNEEAAAQAVQEGNTKAVEPWLQCDEDRLRDYEAICSCSGRYDMVEPTDADHRELARLQEWKQRAAAARGDES